jgi:anti-anti-sigma regulatory factor
MNQSPAKLMVAVFDHTVCIKIEGRADFTLSLDFKRLINELWQRGQRRFVLELCDCATMDSTFLGTLSDIALKFRDDPATKGFPLELFNPGPHIAEVMENLGIADLFKTVTRHQPVTTNFETVARDSKSTQKEITTECLNAHNVLMALKPENVRIFKDVAQFLAEDLQRLDKQEKK